MSVAATTRVEKLQYKEILTPRSDTQTIYPHFCFICYVIFKDVIFNCEYFAFCFVVGEKWMFLQNQ